MRNREDWGKIRHYFFKQENASYAICRKEWGKLISPNKVANLKFLVKKNSMLKKKTAQICVHLLLKNLSQLHCP